MKQKLRTTRETTCPLCKIKTDMRWDVKYDSFKGMCENCKISWYDPRYKLPRWLRQAINKTIIVSL